MAVTTFDNFISKRDVDAGLAKFGNTSFLPVLVAAAAGNPTASNLVFYACRQVIGATFFKYFLGDKKYWKRRIANGDDTTWAGEVYTRLKKTADSFLNAPQGKRAKASELPESEVLKLFQGYLYMRLKSLAIYLNTVESREGISGMGKQGTHEEPKFVNINPTRSEDETGFDIPSSTATPAEEFEAKDTASRYLEMLKTKYPELYKIIILLVKGYTKEQVWTKLNIKPYKFYALKRQADELFQKYTA